MTDARPDAPVMPAASFSDDPDLFDDIITKIKFEPLTRSEQYAQLRRLAAAPAEGVQPVARERKLRVMCDAIRPLIQGAVGTGHWGNGWPGYWPICDAALTALESLAATPQAEAAGVPLAWQPIATAPKDGSWILLGYHLDEGGGGQPCVAMWHARYDKWCDGTTFLNGDGYFSPTHWMPLPKAPREGSEPKAARTYTDDEVLKYGRICFWRARATTDDHEPMPSFDLIDDPHALRDALAAARDSQAPAAPAAPVDALRKLETQRIDALLWLNSVRAGDSSPVLREIIRKARAALSRPQAEQEPT